jgi:hypothetical protein
MKSPSVWLLAEKMVFPSRSPLAIFSPCVIRVLQHLVNGVKVEQAFVIKGTLIEP